MRPKMIITTLLTFFYSGFSNAQSPFPTIEYVDVGNIKAATMVHGDMWWNPGTQLASCEFPKGSGKHCAFASALWMGGYDAGNQLHIAAQTYRQNGNDYWPGPLDTGGRLSYATSQAWAKIWKVNRTQIDSFLQLSSHTRINTPAPILQWPAKGNPHATGNAGVSLTITNDMAPFVDVNHDGLYDPLQGDYPAIKGDQTLWWVFSDNGPTHNETNGQPLKVEIHAMAYAYSRGNFADNTIFYQYTIINRSANTYNNFRVGLHADMDLGYAFDDMIGFDSTHRMGIVYNGNTTDGYGQVNSYGNMIPMSAVTILASPGDNVNSYAPTGSFMYYNVGNSGFPQTPGQYNNYLRSRWKDSTHLQNDYVGFGHQTTGYGSGHPECNYVYPGNLADTSQWSECASTNMPGDRRFIITSNDVTLFPGSVEGFTMALLTTYPTLNNGCGNASFTSIKSMADSVWYLYAHPYPSAGISTVQVPEPLHVYPNPSHDKIFIDNLPAQSKVIVYNMLGQAIHVPVTSSGNVTTFDIAALATGIYNIRYGKDGYAGTARFVKE